MNTKYLIYAIFVTAVTTVVCWASLFDSSSSSTSGRGSSFSSGRGYSGGGGHK